MKPLLCIFSLFLAISSPASTDPFNAYIWEKNQKGGWFEWWYYKVVIPETNQAYFFTYGVINPGGHKSGKSQAHVEFGSFSEKLILSEKFSLQNFEARKNETWIKIGPNHATDKTINGSLAGSDESLNFFEPSPMTANWDLKISNKWQFNAMGWATGFKHATDIFWYPAQANAVMNGEITVNGALTEVIDAPAYQDKNWGKSFPPWWAWLVSNHFENSPGTALAAGGGKPKLFGFLPLIKGLTIGFKHKGKEYSFRPNYGATGKTEIRFGKWEVSSTNLRGQKIEISAYAPPEEFMVLKFDGPNGKTFYDYEALKGKIEVRLYQRTNQWFGKERWRLIADVTSYEGGIEFGSSKIQDIPTFFAKPMTLY